MKHFEPPYGETPLSPDELEALLPDARYVLGGDTINKLAAIVESPEGTLDILRRPELVEQIRQSLDELAANQAVTLTKDELLKSLPH